MFTSSRTQSASARRVARAAVSVAVVPLLAFPGLTAGPSRSFSASSPSAPLVSGLVTQDLTPAGGQTAASLVRELVGPGAIVSNVQYTGAPIAAGTFTGGSGIIGFDSGIVLGSGNINLVVGPNNSYDNVEAILGVPGDPDLDAVIDITGAGTYDATVLEFDLEIPGANTISFQYVFSSDEYDEVVAFGINDGFACFVNGQNIALIPGTSSMVSIQFVNCSDSYDPPTGGVHCEYYISNDCNSLGLGFPCTNLATEMDGLTTVLTATGTLQPGMNHIKLAIADHNDEDVDSNVFIRAHSLDGSMTPPVFTAPTPYSEVLRTGVGVPVDFSISASSANGLPGESVTLTVAGDPVLVTGGMFSPPLPAGPAQPVSTHFTWSPTLAEVGVHHLDFTATDQMGESAICSVLILVGQPGPPDFQAPSPCGQIVDAHVGVPMSFEIAVSAMNGPPGLTLSVAGDPVPLAGGTFVPPLPAGPAMSFSTQFTWTPTLAEVGVHHLDFTASDQTGVFAVCSVTVDVALPDPPEFLPPSPCGQIVDAYVGVPTSFGVAVSAVNGAPGATLSVAGDPVPLTGGAFVPPLPAGPAMSVSTQFTWTPTLADVGMYTLDFTATDQMPATATCRIVLRVRRLPGTDFCQPGLAGVMDCPCGNPPANAPRGCANSSATGGARLTSLGGASLANDTLVFTTDGERPNVLSILIQGNSLLPSGVRFGQGVRCFGGALKRLYVKTSSSGGSITAPGAGDPTVQARSAQRGDHIQSGEGRFYAAYYRSQPVFAGCLDGLDFNITQAQEVLWGP